MIVKRLECIFVTVFRYTVILFLAVYRAKNIARQADIVAALTLEVLQGSLAAYDPGVFPSVHLTLFYHHCGCHDDDHQKYTAQGHTAVNR